MEVVMVMRARNQDGGRRAQEAKWTNGSQESFVNCAHEKKNHDVINNLFDMKQIEN
jgi:hypothetical protein